MLICANNAYSIGGFQIIVLVNEANQWLGSFMSYGSRKIRTEFTAAGLTHFGGVYLFHQFLQQLRLRSYLSWYLSLPQRNNQYSLTEVLLALVYPMILGLEKIEVSALLKTNGVFQYLTGLPHIPDPTTLRRFLVRSASVLLGQVRSAHNVLRRHFLALPATPSSFWLDCDSTAHTLYGKQEGVVKGYNPGHPGKKSYHPLIVTEAHRSDCLGGYLRPGNAYTSEGIQELLITILSFLPHHQRLRLRADAGFYDGDFIAFLKEKHIEFALVGHLTAPIKSIVGGLRYSRVSPIFSVAEFSYQAHRWKNKERFVALRRRVLDQEGDGQLTLFTIDRFAYSVLVTNLDLEPYKIFQFYQDRSAMERIVRILKDDYPFATAPTHSFEANALYAELSLLAYNLIIWFKRLCLPQEWQSSTLSTIRHRLLLMPGQFVRAQNIPTLRFPRNSLYQDAFFYAQSKIRNLSPLF
jgi:hypothetical protein